jgi:CheY-like chemotaxis protein
MIVADARGIQQVEVEAKASSAPLRRILIVDDEEKLAMGLRDGLETLPECKIAVATGSEQALQLFKQQPFDLLITDYKMPGTNGLMLATRIRQLYPQTVIIMITAYVHDVLSSQVDCACIQRILEKPTGLQEIRSAALEALEGGPV